MSSFLERLKEPSVVLAVIVGLVITFGSGFLSGAHWYVSSELDPLRNEVTRLTKIIEDNRSKLVSNGERLAGMTATLSAAGDQADRLRDQVDKNTDAITEVKISMGTPDSVEDD